MGCWLGLFACLCVQLILLIDRVRCLFRLHFFFGTAVSRIIRHSGKYGICEQRLWETNRRCTSDGLSRGCRWRRFSDSLVVWVSCGSGLKKAGILVVWSVRTGYLDDSLPMISPSRTPVTQNYHQEHHERALFI